jgi:hypothetical protein
VHSLAKLTIGRRRDVIKRGGLLEIHRLQRLDLDGAQQALTFVVDFSKCVHGPRDALEQAVDAFFSKYNAILG